ncbi:F0F1 ATP synthase subunit B [Thermodesulfatator atlanticus]|uniref:F0F1 ATP synthase subunit B n=1 Tax=Thermodesulfatator atlanticus TaxID=501497 RepID=UPI0003B31703|nr:F0F1 ATP synthase subunit B [Thermodesulfatator atlanticus]
MRRLLPIFFLLVWLVVPSFAVEEHATPATAGHEMAAEHAAGAQEAMGHGASHEVKPHVTKRQLQDLLWWTVNFIALVIILVKFGREPIVNIFRSRRERIEGEYSELTEKRAEAERKYKEYEAKLATLEEEAKKIMEAFIEQGEKEKERIIQEALATAERIKQQAEFYVQQELEKAREELRKEVAELSVKMAEQIIKEKITPEDHKRLVKEFIERVVH